MIFVTIGTSEPFDRLLQALEGAVTEEPILIQRGASSACPPGATAVDFLPFDEFIDHLRRARVVVMHAGVGSILAAISVGQRPVVVARRRRFGEAVDDHQLEFARRMHETGRVVHVDDLSQLPEAIAPSARMASVHGRSASAPDRPPTTLGALAHDIRAFLRAEIPGVTVESPVEAT
jgi:UDP-N-acetylglucosamine transferase subunit ALG13